MKTALIIDNAPWHAGGPVPDTLAESPHRELDCLPGYSPQLNPIERFWKKLRRRAAPNRLFDTLVDRKTSLRAGLSYFQTVRHKVRSIIQGRPKRKTGNGGTLGGSCIRIDQAPTMPVGPAAAVCLASSLAGKSTGGDLLKSTFGTNYSVTRLAPLAACFQFGVHGIAQAADGALYRMGPRSHSLWQGVEDGFFLPFVRDGKPALPGVGHLVELDQGVTRKTAHSPSSTSLTPGAKPALDLGLKLGVAPVALDALPLDRLALRPGDGDQQPDVGDGRTAWPF
jgi:hypothetical protein